MLYSCIISDFPLTMYNIIILYNVWMDKECEEEKYVLKKRADRSVCSENKEANKILFSVTAIVQWRGYSAFYTFYAINACALYSVTLSVVYWLLCTGVYASCLRPFALFI